MNTKDALKALHKARIPLDDVAPSVGISRQAITQRAENGTLDALAALALIRAAIVISADRLDSLKAAAKDLENE